ncbi:MAG: S46 family peptidase [Rhodothermaceae bacterium]
MKSILRVLSLLLFVQVALFAQKGLYEPIDYSKLKGTFNDFGKMWTFDDIPFEKWEQLYGFKPDTKWLEDVQKSALQFGGGCSGAFVSPNGLIMTNHHCARGRLRGVQKDGENLLRDGFYAPTLAEERRLPGLYVDQLIAIEDVTSEIIEAINAGETNAEKVENRKDKIKELEENYSEETGLLCKVVTLYNGGKYSLYAYKRYEDIRVVMSPDFQIAATGWDWDNFTYPRYELDFMFLRAYDENGEPVKTKHYFEWSKEGAAEDELIFTVGRPGNTDRLLSVKQLEYFRDYTYPQILTMLNEAYKIATENFNAYPEREAELLNVVMGIGNGRKSYAGRYMALRDEFVMAKKRDFEKKLIEKINSIPELKNKYGHLWKNIDVAIDELKQYPQRLGYGINRFSPKYFRIAKKLISDIGENPDMGRMSEEKINDYVDKLFGKEFNFEEETKKLSGHSKFLYSVFKNNDRIANMLYNKLTGKEAIAYVKANSFLTDKNKLVQAIKNSPRSILDPKDVILKYVIESQNYLKEISPKVKEVENTLVILNQQLGEAVFAAFGDKIPPDATSTLRISDGQIKQYEYNGTLAPGKVTYYGLWDRYNSFDKSTYPWGLHERWKTPPADLDLKTFIGFASTNDIVGGNSGSSIINKNQEVIGLAHDGNLESLAGTFIFLPEENRTVATDSHGLMEALKYIFKTDALVKELQTGKISKN